MRDWPVMFKFLRDVDGARALIIRSTVPKEARAEFLGPVSVGMVREVAERRIVFQSGFVRCSFNDPRAEFNWIEGRCFRSAFRMDSPVTGESERPRTRFRMERVWSLLGRIARGSSARFSRGAKLAIC